MLQNHQGKDMQPYVLVMYLLQHKFVMEYKDYLYDKGFDMFPEYMPIWKDNQHQLGTLALGPVHTLKWKFLLKSTGMKSELRQYLILRGKQEE